jgi:hypothetical protein
VSGVDRDATEERQLGQAELDADEPSPLLSALVDEARREPVPALADDAEARLFARLDREDGKVVALPRRAWMIAGLVAAAAVAVLFVGGRQGAPVDAPAAAVTPRGAGTLAQTAARVTIGGAPVTPGAALHAGDVVAVSGGTARFDEPRVQWAMEDGAEVAVQRTQEGIVLRLLRGATEAEVVPVPHGEAFAVDVVGEGDRAARIAVHGTHLRVARDGDHVVVDLTEGVVSIGRPPKAGSTYGTLVTAPAHVEFDVGDPSALRVDHAPSAVRAAIDLSARSHTAAPEPAPVASLSPPDDPPRAAPSPRPPAHPPVPTREPSDLVADAVRACFAQSRSAPPSAPGVRVSVSTTLEIPVDREGVAHSFTFDPPLPGDVQICASKTIFATRFAPGRAPVRLFLELSR